MITAARAFAADRGASIIPLTTKRKPDMLRGVDMQDSPGSGVALTPSQVTAVKAALAAQKAALEGNELAPEVELSLDTTFTKAVDLPDNLPELMDARPMRYSGKKKGEVTLRSTGSERVTDSEAKAKREEKARVKAIKREAFKKNPVAAKVQTPSSRKRNPVVVPESNTNTSLVDDVVQSSALPSRDADSSLRSDKTLEVCWTQRVNRKTTKIVRVKRTEAYEQWFYDNPPDGLKYTKIQPRVEGRYECRTFTQSACVRIGNLDVNLGFTVRKSIPTPVGISEKQREEGLLKRYHTKVSRTKMPAAVKSRVLTLMTASLNNSKPKVDKVTHMPWAEARQAANDSAVSVTEDASENEVVDYDDPGRIARIRHRAYIKYHVLPNRLASRTYHVMPPFEVSKALKPQAVVKNEGYDFFESGDYSARVMTNLLRNEADAKLRALHAGHTPSLFDSSEWLVSQYNNTPVFTRIRPKVASMQPDLKGSLDPVDDHNELAEKLEAFNKSLVSAVPLTAEQVTQAVFNATHYRPDLRTKKQVAREELNAQKVRKKAETDAWIEVNIMQRKALMEEEDRTVVRQAINWLDEKFDQDKELASAAQETACLQAWLCERDCMNHEWDAHRYDAWLVKHSGRGYFNELHRALVTVDDARHAAWLFDNAGEEYHLQRWLFLNDTPRVGMDDTPKSDNVIDMMEWRHRRALSKGTVVPKGTDHKASVKKEENTILWKLTLPPKSHEICVYDSLLAEYALKADKKRDAEVTSFGKVTRDIRKVIAKFNLKDEKSGLYLPDYFKDTSI